MSIYLALLASMIMSLNPMPIPTSTIGIINQGISQEKPVIEKLSKNVESYSVWITAYSSTPEETDDTPFITASGTTVRHGIVATNMLPFGSKIQIPELFGEKIFVVEDRMHQRKTNFVDIWMPSKEDALRFGINKTEIVVLR